MKLSDELKDSIINPHSEYAEEVKELIQKIIPLEETIDLYYKTIDRLCRELMAAGAYSWITPEQAIAETIYK